MKTFEQFIKEQNAKIIQVMGEKTFLEEKIFFAEEVIKLVEQWQLLQQTPCYTALELLQQILKELQRLNAAGYEDFKDLMRGSENERALQRVIRLIGERQANAVGNNP